MNFFIFKNLKNNKPAILFCCAFSLFLGLPEQVHAQSHEGHDHGHEGHAHHEEVIPTIHDDHHDHEGHEHRNEAEHDDHTGHEEAGALRVAPEVLREFDITLGVAEAGVLHEEVVLPGEIQFNREQLAYVTPRYAGTVLRIKARLADRVKKGQVIATLESTDTLRPFDVIAPFDGTITDYDLTLGQTVETGASLFTVADLSSVWADLRIYQRDIGRIAEGQSVRVEGGHGRLSYRGKISYISPVIDEHTRTGLARINVTNTKELWKPGQFIKGSVSIEEHQAGILIPRTAVLNHEGKTVVFIQTKEGFEPRQIITGDRDSEFIEVVSGLQSGDVIVIRNAISLKAELGKASFGGHEGHAH